MNGDDQIIVSGLRSGIQIIPGATNEVGRDTWVIHDPLQHRYYQIGCDTKIALDHWQAGVGTDHIAQQMSSELGTAFNVDDVNELEDFLRQNNLLDIENVDWRELQKKSQSTHKSAFEYAAQAYLFFRIPIFQPEAFLNSTLPLVRPLFSKIAIATYLLAGVIGLYLISRQWTEFIGSFQDIWSPQGMVYFSICLLLLKAMHELGHAYSSTHFGCQVRTMGIAFMTMIPLLYTDISDTWRIVSRKNRIIVSASGVLVEISIAMVATFAWSFLPLGLLKDLAFVLATTGWISSLVFNLNPCMKFDGYYILSDLLKIDNLQFRAFAIARWKMRQLLITKEVLPPEIFTKNTAAFLIGYSWVTWIFRLVMYTAIALLVYHFSFKLLGIVLFVVEIWLLLAKPIFVEIKTWTQFDANHVSRSKLTITSAICILFVGFLIVPWSGSVRIPAVITASDLHKIYAPGAAMITESNFSTGKPILSGTSIMRLLIPNISQQIDATKIKINATQTRLHQSYSGIENRAQSIILQQELLTLQAQLDGLRHRENELTVRAPISGMIVQMEPNLHPGRWIEQGSFIATISSGNNHIIRGYIDWTNQQRVTIGAYGRFVPEDLTRASVPVKLARKSITGISSVKIAELASINGGDVAVQLGKNEKLVPRTAQFLIEFEPLDGNYAPNQIVRGTVKLVAQNNSIVSAVWKTMIATLNNELHL